METTAKKGDKGKQVPTPKEAPLTIAEGITTLYVLQAIKVIDEKLRFKNKKGEGRSYLSPVNIRSMERETINASQDLADAIEDIDDYIDKNTYREILPDIKKLSKYRMTATQQIPKKYDKYMVSVDDIMDELDTEAREIFTNEVWSAIELWRKKSNSAVNALIFCMKYHRLPLRLPVSYLCKMAVKGAPKRFEVEFNRAKKSGGLTKQDKGKVSELFVSNKAPKEHEINHKDYPEYFTFEKPYLRLDQPIVAGHPKDGKDNDFVIYSPYFDFDDLENSGFYCKSRHPETGRWGAHYVKQQVKIRAKRNQSKVAKLKEDYPKIKKKLAKALKASDEKTQVLAVIVWIIDKAPFRIGNNRSQKENVFGLHNLQKRHVTFRGKTMKFEFLAKDRQSRKQTLKIDNTRVRNIISSLLSNKSPDDYVFTVDGKKVTDRAVNSFLQSDLGSRVTIHKFRALKTNHVFEKIVENLSEFDHLSKTDKKKLRKRVLNEVATMLNHKNISTTVNHYLDKGLLAEFDAKLDIDNTPTKKAKKSKPKSKSKPSKNVTKQLLKRKKGEILGEEIASALFALYNESIAARKGGDFIDADEEDNEPPKRRKVPKKKEKKPNRVQKAPIKRARKRKKFPKDSRIVIYVEERKGLFIGTVIKNKNEELTIKLDNKDTVTLPITSKFIIGPGTKRSKDKAINPDLLKDFILGKVPTKSEILEKIKREKATSESEMEDATRLAKELAEIEGDPDEYVSRKVQYERKLKQNLKKQGKKRADVTLTVSDGVPKLITEIDNYFKGVKKEEGKEIKRKKGIVGLTNLPKVLEENKDVICPSHRPVRFKAVVKFNVNETKKRPAYFSIAFGKYSDPEDFIEVRYDEKSWMWHYTGDEGSGVGYIHLKHKKMSDSRLCAIVEDICSLARTRLGGTSGDKVLLDLESYLKPFLAKYRKKLKRLELNGLFNETDLYNNVYRRDRNSLYDLAEDYNINVKEIEENLIKSLFKQYGEHARKFSLDELIEMYPDKTVAEKYEKTYILSLLRDKKELSFQGITTKDIFKVAKKLRILDAEYLIRNLVIQKLQEKPVRYSKKATTKALIKYADIKKVSWKHELANTLFRGKNIERVLLTLSHNALRIVGRNNIVNFENELHEFHTTILKAEFNRQFKEEKVPKNKTVVELSDFLGIDINKQLQDTLWKVIKDKVMTIEDALLADGWKHYSGGKKLDIKDPKESNMNPVDETTLFEKGDVVIRASVGPARITTIIEVVDVIE